MKKLLLVAILTMMVNQSHAVMGMTKAANTAEPKTFKVRGMRSCGEWISKDVSDQSWLIGFLAGLDVAREQNVLNGTDNLSLYLWMDNYCRSNPLSNLYYGSEDLFDELKKQKGLK